MQASRKARNIGEHIHHAQCRFCLAEGVIGVIDFGNVPLAGGFLKSSATAQDFENEKFYPLQICFCPKCYLLQVSDVVATEVLYKDYFYFSSAIKTLVDHFIQYAEEMKQIFPDAGKRLIVELGCNDGVFLKPLKKHGFKVIGVDPATSVVQSLIKEGFTVINNCFTEAVAKGIAKKHGKADVIMTSNSFAHIDNMHDVMKGVKALLKNDGILCIEVHYLGVLLEEAQYDMMYHDHMSYYSLASLSNFFSMYGMEIYDVKMTSIHAGSIRFYVQNKKGGKHKISKVVRDLKKKEKKMGLDKASTYHKFFEYVKKTKKELMVLLATLKKQGKTVVGYGASGRATAIMSFCGITTDHLEYVIDDAPAKQGAYTPGNHLKIRSSEMMHDKKRRPDYCLVFAWSFINEIKKRNLDYLASGGKFIVPLPKVKVIGK
ncbi:MAG: class I SAM-dependent methyltransferase [Patescibacteria group bacterium]